MKQYQATESNTSLGTGYIMATHTQQLLLLVMMIIGTKSHVSIIKAQLEF